LKRKLIDTGVDVVLIGESLMRSADRKRFLQELKAAVDNKKSVAAAIFVFTLISTL